MKYKAIIFDLDGVICHTDQYHYKAWKAIAHELGIYFDEQINHRLRGVSRMESFDIILEGYEGSMDSKVKEAYANKKNEIYVELLKNISPSDLSEEVKSTMDSLRGEGCKLAIGSSSKNARLILRQLGVGDYFDGISDGNHLTKSKPDPEVFLKAASLLGEKAENCLVVEDAKAGLEAAIAANMDCAAVKDAISCNIATYNLDRFSQLLEAVR